MSDKLSESSAISENFGILVNLLSNKINFTAFGLHREHPSAWKLKKVSSVINFYKLLRGILGGLTINHDLSVKLNPTVIF